MAIGFPFFRKRQTGWRSAFTFFGKGKPNGDRPSLFSEKSNRLAFSLPFFRKRQTGWRSAFPFFGKFKPDGDQPSLFSEKANRTAISLPTGLESQTFITLNQLFQAMEVLQEAVGEFLQTAGVLFPKQGFLRRTHAEI
ncbi:MAG: hypothetical protein LBP64_02315, partial [Tannerella sp.]|nr:hypothetical protein [Tannerella sp.]